MKFRMIVNNNITLDTYIHSEDDHKLHLNIQMAKSVDEAVKIAFAAMKKRLKGNYETIRPVGFVS